MKRMSLVTLLGVAGVLTWAVPALAQHPLHPYYSNSRAQIGNGLPIPITFDAPPYGRIRPVPGATAMGSAMKGAAISLSPTALSAPIITKNIGVWKSNNKVFQVQTSLGIKLPKVAGTLMANGRTGPTAVTWCPGLKKSATGAVSALPTGTSVVGYNPGCAFPSPMAETRPHTINSALKYSKTVAQFGGTGQGLVLGGGMTFMGGPGRGAVVALKGGVNPPCVIGTLMCVAAFDTVVPAVTGAQGAAFGFSNMTPGAPAVTPGVFLVTALGPSVAFPGALGGTIAAVGPVAAVNMFTNKATSWGGPLTTGSLTILAQNTANGMTEVFGLMGYDTSNPTAGTRVISLVSGAVSRRTASLPNSNRGWVTLHLPEPGAMLGTLGALIALVGCHRLARRRS
jgi:hypothetical protein